MNIRNWCLGALLLAVGAASTGARASIPQVQEYRDELILMKDFLNLSVKAELPISYWINQLIGIFEKKRPTKMLAQKLKNVRKHPEKIFKVLKAHSDQLSAALRAYLYSFGVPRAQEALDKRLMLSSQKETPHEESLTSEQDSTDLLDIVENVVDLETTDLNELPNELLDEQSTLKGRSSQANTYYALSLVALAAIIVSMQAQ